MLKALQWHPILFWVKAEGFGRYKPLHGVAPTYSGLSPILLAQLLPVLFLKHTTHVPACFHSSCSLLLDLLPQYTRGVPSFPKVGIQPWHFWFISPCFIFLHSSCLHLTYYIFTWWSSYGHCSSPECQLQKGRDFACFAQGLISST